MEFEGKCHYCGGDMTITEAVCQDCKIAVKGEFESCDLCKLSFEAKQFIKVFIECDGNIKNVEKAMGISYPTVKSRLALVKEEMKNLTSPYIYEDFSESTKRKTILKSIEKGNINVEEALKLLREEEETEE